jgi:hypothetical protein
MSGTQIIEPRATGDADDDWLRQYYTQGKTDPLASGAPAPELTRRPAEKYAGEQRLGAGGEKEVVQVHDRDTGRDVALARPRAGRPVAAFVREARILARLEHPHIVPVHDLGVGPDGRPYFTMKLLSGETLETVLARLRAGDVETAARYPRAVLLEIFVRVCDAVAFAHAQGVLHRDIKPANVQVGRYGEVRLMDWGLAKRIGSAPEEAGAGDAPLPDSIQTMAGTVKGTPGYMAPEQARGEPADPRTDVYALGALLYALLTWHPPVTGAHTAEVLANTVAGVIVPPQQRAPARAIPRALAAIAVKALSTAAAHRYAKVEALRSDVQSYLDGYATTAETAGPLRLLWLVVKRHRAVSWVLLAGLVALAVTGAISVARIRASRDETQAALARLRLEQTVRAQLTRPAVSRLLADARTQARAAAADEALALLRMVVGVDPSQAEAWEFAGWIYLGQERFNLAKAAFGRDWQAFAEESPPERALQPPPAESPAATPAPVLAPRAKRRGGALRAAGTAYRQAVGMRLAEQGRLAAQAAPEAGVPPQTFQRLLEEARGPGGRLAAEGRIALGIYCRRHNPTAATRPEQLALVSWAMRVCNEGHTVLVFSQTPAGLMGHLSGSTASDLTPLAGLPLVGLDLHDTAVRDLQPLRGMPLQELDLSNTPVVTFDALAGMPLRELRAYGLRKIPADLFTHCPTLSVVGLSPDAELSRKDSAWPAHVRQMRRPAP